MFRLETDPAELRAEYFPTLRRLVLSTDDARTPCAGAVAVLALELGALPPAARRALAHDMHHAAALLAMQANADEDTDTPAAGVIEAKGGAQ
jgi:hypothetical protein